MNAETKKDLEIIPTGQLKQVRIKDIRRDSPRFRQDFSNIDTLVESIKDKGVLQPVTLAPDLRILAGERRIRAAELAGLEKIPAIIRKIDGEIDAREIELIENTFREDFTWQERVRLIAEINRLYKEKDLDWSGRKTAQLIDKSRAQVARSLELAQAFNILPELAEQPTAHDAYKILKQFEENIVIAELRRRQEVQLAEPTGTEQKPAVPGQAPELKLRTAFSPDKKQRLEIAKANYQIGDALLGLAELRSDGVVHLIECDPPYGVEIMRIKAGADNNADTAYQDYTEVKASDYPKFLEGLTAELYRVAGRDCWLIFWFASTWHNEVKQALLKAKWDIDNVHAVWIKNRGQTQQPEMFFARCYEPFFLCRKGQPIMAKRGRSNVFDYPELSPGQKYHPTERPLPLIDELLSTLTLPGQVVLVPFLGSGATLRACYKKQLLAFGWEISDKFKDRFMLAVEDDFREPLSQNETVPEQA